MIQKELVERLLKANEVSPAASDEEIRSVLVSARWHDKDVETALLVLREQPAPEGHNQTALHKVFWSDEKLQPDTITALLGIETTVDAASLGQNTVARRPSSLLWQVFTIVSIAAVIAAVCLAFGMWYFEVGAFHSSFEAL